MSQPRIIIGTVENNGIPISAPIVKSIAPHSLITFRWIKAEDGKTFVLQQRINSTHWVDVPFFQQQT